MDVSESPLNSVEGLSNFFLPDFDMVCDSRPHPSETGDVSFEEALAISKLLYPQPLFIAISMQIGMAEGNTGLLSRLHFQR